MSFRAFLIATSRLVGLAIACQAAVMPAARADEPSDTEGVKFFQEKIAPVLKAECYRCHSEEAEKVRGGLLLDSVSGMLKGGDTGPAIVARESGESLLIQ